MNNHILIDKTITSIQITTDKKSIRFLLSDGSYVVAYTDGECCSSTWIEHIILPAGGFPAVVTEADYINMPDFGSPTDGECIKYYGFELKTDKGSIVIDYRNESNGYYGGRLVWPGEYCYGGVYGQNRASGEWTNIESDM